MPAAPLADMTTRMMLTVTLPGPLNASMPLLALKLAELSAMATLIAPEPPLPSTRSPSPVLLIDVEPCRRVTFAAMPPVGLDQDAGRIAEDRRVENKQVAPWWRCRRRERT